MFPKFNKRSAFNKAVGPGKKSKINKCRAYVHLFRTIEKLAAVNNMVSFFALGTYLLKKIEFFFYLLDNFQTEQDFKKISLFYMILLKSNGWFWSHTN